MVDVVSKEQQLTHHRWIILVLVSLVIGMNYYAYDSLSSIKQTLQQHLGISSTDYGLIVAFYAVPNTFLLMTVFGGMILDRIGIRRTGTLFTFFCALGVLLTAYGASEFFRSGGPGHGLLGAFLVAYSPELKVMILGRLLFGLGAETSIVVINKVLAKWFRSRELALAFGLNLSVARLGTAAALILSPLLIKSATGWTLAPWVASFAMWVGFGCFVVYALYDRRLSPRDQPGSLLDPEEVFRARDVLALLKNRAFISITLLCVTFYSAIFPFQAFCPDFLHHKFSLSLENAGLLTSLIIWGTILFTPLLGWYVDRHGKRASLMVYGSGMLLVAHLILALAPAVTAVALLAMFILGIAFSLVPASMWPSVALIVEEKRLGTAYGVMTSIQNLGLFAFPILAGKITDLVNADALAAAKAAGEQAASVSLDYRYTILMFAVLGVAGFFFSFMLKKAGPGLEEGAVSER